MSKQHAQMSEGVSFKSLDSESIGAARAAARASGMSLEDWLSRTILESVRARGEAAGGGDDHGRAGDEPGWAVARDDPDETIDAITRHLNEAKAAADQAGVSVAEWLSRTILDNALEEQAAANSNLPGAGIYPFAATSKGSGPGRSGPDLPEPDLPDDSQEDRLARIIAARRAEVEAEEKAKQPDLLADLEMPERPMTLTKNMQMPNTLPRFEAERRRRFPWLWLSVMLLMVAVAAIIWVVPHLPGPVGGNPNETTVAVGGGTGGDAKPPTGATGKTPDATGGKSSGTGPGTGTGTADAKPPKAGDAKTSEKAPKGGATGAPSGTSSAAKKADPATKAPATALPRSSETRLDKLPKPIEKHLGWYQRAADGGNATAQFALGSYMIRQKNMKAAATYMQMAAHQGHAEAQYTLGALYAYGLGVPKSDVDAVLMYNKAADQGYVPAITEVGLAYLHGRGVERNLKKAFTSLERAAEANEPNAQYTLGRLYESGIGVEKDAVTAFKWFILAAENKHQLAASRVEDLSIDLSRDQRERGSELVREHKQRFPKKGS